MTSQTCPVDELPVEQPMLASLRCRASRDEKSNASVERWRFDCAKGSRRQGFDEGDPSSARDWMRSTL